MRLMGVQAENRIICFPKTLSDAGFCVRFVRHVAMILMLPVVNWWDRWLTVPVVPNSGKESGAATRNLRTQG